MIERTQQDTEQFHRDMARIAERGMIMDPLANIREQVNLARGIVADFDAERPIDQHDAARLAELVIALDEWRRGGGFDPYRK